MQLINKFDGRLKMSYCGYCKARFAFKPKYIESTKVYVLRMNNPLYILFLSSTVKESGKVVIVGLIRL